LAKGKVATEALEALSKTKFARGAGIVSGAKVAEEAVDNPYAQAAIGAAEGAALGAALGPWGAAGGAVAGGLLGFVLADGERIVPIDMIAIPAYQYSLMLQGKEPTFQVYIKEGEVIMPVMPTDAQVAGALVLDETPMPRSKPRKLSKWNKYVKNKKNHIYYKSGKNKGKLNLSAMAKKGGFGKKKGGKK
tara:strand:- start:1415 stop:1984 length:570 start_codon:yes stop_codon:yes gene_type:complete